MLKGGVGGGGERGEWHAAGREDGIGTGLLDILLEPFSLCD